VRYFSSRLLPDPPGAGGRLTDYVTRNGLVIVALVALALIGGAWYLFAGSKPAGAGAPGKSASQAVAVVTAHAAQKDFAHEVEALGTLRANESVDITAKVADRVAAIHFNEGQQVRKGDVLVEIEPLLPVADRTTISEKTGEIEQLIAVAEARLRRLRPLAERGAVPQGQIADAETELEGLRRRREVIRNVGREREPLRASTDGVIATVRVVPGQVVQAQDLLFQIVDPKALWVEALAYGDLTSGNFSDASAATTSGQTMAVAYQGTSRALQNHAAVLHFAIPQPPPNLSVGQPITVVAKNGASAVSGLVVKRDAVARDANGESIVWLQSEPERFEPRPVRTVPVDAAHLAIAGGVAEGERVVVRGTDLINQIR